jgi:uncharacterized protein with NRDE domain
MAKASSGGRKSTELEYNEKITEALELILYKRLSSGEFRTTFSKLYGVSERAADSVWKRCKDIIKERFAEEQGELIEQQLMRYFDLLERARMDNNKRVEREALDSITKLYGLEAPKKLDLTSNGEQISVNIILNNE